MTTALIQIVILGASGDLAARKLVPALAANIDADTFGAPLQVIGVARRPKSSEDWREELSAWIPRPLSLGWQTLAPQVHYLAGDSARAADVATLAERLDDSAAAAGKRPEECGRLFYLALAPALFGSTVRALHQAGLTRAEPGDGRAWRRVVVEKPFGSDLDSAQALNAELLECLREEQILRIDHYLGKETVQNILLLRFENAIFEPLWNRSHVESVEITVAESIGVEGGRGGYYDQAGALRDMLQNHVLQVLSLVAMEAPTTLSADDVRDQKVQVLRALTPFTPERVRRDVVRGRYEAGPERDRGYLDEPGVTPGSCTETYVALRTGVRNWRWNGVPFLLRTGKALARRYTEVVLRFRVPPVDLLGDDPVDACPLRPNDLRLLVQPHEGIRLSFLVKRPGPGVETQAAALGFDYADLPGAVPSADAYQRLLLDAVQGNATLFIRGDEVEAAWRFADSVRAGWQGPDAPPLHGYPAGGMGPALADELFRGCEGAWTRGPSHEEGSPT